MDLKQLQELMKREKGKVIIVEDGEPVLIVMPYEKETQEEIVGMPIRFNKTEEVGGQIQEELTIDDLPL